MSTLESTRSPEQAPAASTRKLLADLSSGWKMKAYYLRKLPTLWWWRVRVDSATPDQCRVSLPYTWRTQNPFRSIYFAALAGAAELSTGLLGMLAVADSGESVSMLITGLEAEFIKKADQRIVFTCADGVDIREAVAEAVSSGKGQTIRVESTGRTSEGLVVARFYLTWSFKLRSRS